jgi:hypothetical protein
MSLGLLGRLQALDLRVDPDVVQRSGDDCDEDSARFGAAIRRGEVAALSGGDQADDESDHNDDSADGRTSAHGSLLA